jgi:hypothetical protein
LIQVHSNLVRIFFDLKNLFIIKIAGEPDLGELFFIFFLTNMLIWGQKERERRKIVRTKCAEKATQIQYKIYTFKLNSII